jgi:hypothetical protein
MNRLASFFTAAVLAATAVPGIAEAIGVVFYQDTNFGGVASGEKGPGEYSVLPGDVPNDWMSSLRVPTGWTVDAYSNGGLSGSVCTFTANTSWVGTSCNDVMSSFRIRTTTVNTAYIKNRAPLVQTPFVPLNTGAVRAEGWLLTQLQNQKTGATGNAESLYGELAPNSAWLGAGQSGDAPDSDWERPPYYVKGLIAVAYVLNDAALKTKAQKWIDWSINSQQPNGAFGPSWNHFDWWPRMPMLYAIKDYYEATGDPRVLPFFTRYFQFQAANLGAHPLTEWAKARAGDNIDIVLWLYNRTGDAFLLTLADTLRNQAYNWTDIFTNNTFAGDFMREHNVNVTQALKMPAIYYQRSNNLADRNAFAAGNTHLMRDHGQVTGMNSGTETLAGRSSTGGVELCAIVERMQSHEVAHMILGDVAIGDQFEKVAFNALPGAVSKDYKLHQYYSLPNMFQAVKGNHQFAQEHLNDLVIAPNSGFPCCRFNMHMGWPYYVKSMWAGTNDNGVAAMAYGPSRVTVRVAGGVDATIVENTNYPFESQIRFTVNTPSSVAFPLKLRIPTWASGASVLVNGVAQSGVAVGTYYTINRTWTNGNTVTLNLPMSIKAPPQVNSSVAIERGPLVYSLQLTENWTQTWAGPLGYNEYEIRSGSPWNYGLMLDLNNPGTSITVQNSPMPANPYIASQAPVKLLANAKKIVWPATARNNLAAAEPQPSPFGSSSVTELVTLVPFGSQNIRMTYFPQVTNGVQPLPPTSSALFSLVHRTSGKCVDLSGGSSADGAKIQLWSCAVGSTNQQFRLNYLGNGYYALVHAVTGKVMDESTVSTADGGIVHQWTWVGSANQHMRFLPTNDGWFRAEFQHSGKLLDVAGCGSADGTQIHQWTWTGSTCQQWRLQPIGHSKIVNMNSNRVADVAGISTADGANIHQWGNNGTHNQQWSFVHLDNGWYRIEARHSGKIIDSAGEQATGDGVNVQQWTWLGALDQQWRLEPLNDGTFRFVVRHNGKVLDVEGCGSGDGANIRLWTWLNNNCQRFRLETP